MDTEVVGQLCHLLQPDPDQFILLAESDKPISSPGYDHLGLLQDTRAEVDELLDGLQALRREGRPRADQGVQGHRVPNLAVHAFYVRYLLPIWFDVQVLERKG